MIIFQAELDCAAKGGGAVVVHLVDCAKYDVAF